MAYHDDLLDQAFALIYREPTNPTQADLRRAVSAAYYALFHMLISETVLNWSRLSSRDSLGRMFEHGIMKRASNRVLDPKKSPFAGENSALVHGLRTVAQVFVQLQDQRQMAHYDNTTFWTATEALRAVTSATKAFEAWKLVRHEDIAQEYLVSLLIRSHD